MPTKKKRVGFIPREDVMRIIEKLSTENNLSNSKNLFDNSDDFTDNAKLSIDTNLGNQFIPSKSTHLNEENQEAFDLQTYKKFLSFLKFQEMMDKYKT